MSATCKPSKAAECSPCAQGQLQMPCRPLTLGAYASTTLASCTRADLLHTLLLCFVVYAHGAYRKLHVTLCSVLTYSDRQTLANDPICVQDRWCRIVVLSKVVRNVVRGMLGWRFDGCYQLPTYLQRLSMSACLHVRKAPHESQVCFIGLL